MDIYQDDALVRFHFVFDRLRENAIQVRSMKQYLLTVLYNAPVTIESHYAAQVNHYVPKAAACGQRG